MIDVSNLTADKYYWVVCNNDVRIVYVYGKSPFFQVDMWPSYESVNPLSIKKWIKEVEELDGRYDVF